MLPQRKKCNGIEKAQSACSRRGQKAGASIYYMKDLKQIREDATGQKFEITYDVAGKSTIGFQMWDYFGTIIDPDQFVERIKPEDPRCADLSAGRETVKQIRKLQPLLFILLYNN
ncbi:hypothetical protein FHR92_000279 [Fontibacillus solani]|uniref:Uncharacterized protein n=1 Tax=Fontibacillus solani TaxID=1572857 RepID=A0A7W3SPH1_9BACL|nr:hypothetical protein [Fontibacillus solani]MBA9083836.1 hypothetical protein [Fontibacillus solani]